MSNLSILLAFVSTLCLLLAADATKGKNKQAQVQIITEVKCPMAEISPAVLPVKRGGVGSTCLGWVQGPA